MVLKCTFFLKDNKQNMMQSYVSKVYPTFYSQIVVTGCVRLKPWLLGLSQVVLLKFKLLSLEPKEKIYV